MALSEQFKEYCKPNLNSKVQEIDDGIYIIEDFFINPIKSSNFFKSLDRWDCDDLANSTKSGMECFLPFWSSTYLMSDILKKNNFFVISDDKCIINMHYYQMKKRHDSYLSSNGTFDMPHHDHISKHNNMEAYVLIVNLNEFDIKTNFWQFNDKKKMDNYDYINFSSHFIEKNKNKNIFDVKMPKEIRICNEVNYKFNEAIIYNSSLLHNASVIKDYTKDDPRVTLNYHFYTEYENKSNSKFTYL